MKTKFQWIAVLAGAPMLGFAAVGDTHEFSPIWQANVFRLTEPSRNPPKVEPLPGQLKLTGIATMQGKKWVVLWIGEAGKPASCVVLEEGGHFGDLKVMRIDPNLGQVKVWNEGAELILTFDRAPRAVEASPQSEDNQ